jgi:RsiW-degrading membrane proteinase PrsW (M82 family)
MTTPNPTATTPDLTAAAGVAPAAPAPAPADVKTHAHETAQAGLTSAPRRRTGFRVFLIVGVIVLALLALGVVAYLINGLGPDAFALGGIMALVPLTIVFFGVRWIDRWEPEPRVAVLFAFLWGGAAAVVIALLVDYRVSDWVNSSSGPGADAYDFFGATIQAPLAEEGGKGLGVLLIFLVARRYFDGPIDGIVYAAWVAGGFAFTENILYFGGQLLDSGGFDGDVGQIFLIRGIMSPFAHVMFTTCTGLAIGFAARRGYGVLGGILFFFIGLIPAMLLHALWNGALYFVYDFFGYYAVVQFPLFLIAVGIMLFLRRQEAKLTFNRLSEYASAGWFKQDEIAALATGRGRRQAIAWARSNGKARAMRRYIRDATSLAFARQRIIIGRDKVGAQADEAALLGAIVESRKNLVGVGSAVTGGPPAPSVTTDTNPKA